MSELQIVVSEESARIPVTVFDIIGEINSNNYELLQTKADEAYNAGMRYLIIDFSGVTFMSSAGLRSIHAIYQKLQPEDVADQKSEYKSQNFKLLNVPDKIYRTIRAIGFDVYVEIHTDKQAALASF